MPKAQKSLQNASDARVKQITDFFPRKSASQGCSSGTRSKNAKHSAAKENTTPHVCNPHSKSQIDNAASSNSSASSAAVSPIPIKAVPQITSPMQPSTKRLRSQSIDASQPTKQAKRRNILCKSTLAEDVMDVDENSIVYVPAVATVATPLAEPSPFLQVPSSDLRKAISPDRDSEVSLVPSSVSDEKELDPTHAGRKDAASVKEVVDQWRQEALPPSPLTSTSSPVEVKTQPQSTAQLHVDADRTMCIDSTSSATPSRRNAATTANASIPTPPSTDGPEDAFRLSPVKLLDEKAKTDQIIAEIRARAFARSRSQAPSSPLSEVTSLDSSDDEDDGYGSLAMLGYNTSTKSKSPIKAKSPVKPTRYNLRKPVPSGEAQLKSIFPSRRDASPSPPSRRKPANNPLNIFLQEKRAIDAKNSMTSADREARLRELADMNLDDYDKDDDPNNASFSGPVFGMDDKNSFLDDDQKREVMDILEGDKAIEDEEEHARQQGILGVALWDMQEPDIIDDLEEALPSLEYDGSDPTLQIFAETVAHGDCHLTHLLMQSGILEIADYRKGGSKVIEYLINLALSFRQDDLDFSALRLLSHILLNNTIVSPVPLVDRIMCILGTFGAHPSVLEKLEWTGHNARRRGTSDLIRSEVIQRMVFCVTDVAKSGRLHWKEIPEIVAVLLLVGLEPSVSQEMRLQVSRTIHVVCQSLGPGNAVEIDVECAIVNKVLCLVQAYSVQNKLHAVSLIANGAGRTARIARSVAHAMLTDKSALLLSQYSALPPIPELLDILDVSSPNAPRPLGKFEYHEAADYVDMACWTMLLAMVVTDVASYMEMEGATRQSTGILSQTPFREEESIFEILHQRLKRVHDRIQDTRAAHLDRSQTKTILNHTLYRILYQSRAIAQYRRKRFGKIHNYMSQK